MLHLTLTTPQDLDEALLGRGALINQELVLGVIDAGASMDIVRVFALLAGLATVGFASWSIATGWRGDCQDDQPLTSRLSAESPATFSDAPRSSSGNTTPHEVAVTGHMRNSRWRSGIGLLLMMERTRQEV